MDIQNLDQQMLAAERELMQDNRRLRGVISGLCGFVSTARRVNNPEWMEALCAKINAALESIGDSDKVRWDRNDDWIYTEREIRSQPQPQLEHGS